MEQVNEQNEQNEQKIKGKSFWGIMKEYLPYLLIGVILASGFRFVISPSEVVGQSMESSLQDGDYLMVNKMAYSDKRLPEYGDIVVLDSEAIEGHDFFIKRIVGKPGDLIEVKDGELFRNEKAVDEPYAKERMESENMKMEVPDGEVFVMGDNRNHSMDSRIFGTIRIQDEVVGKVITRISLNWIPFDREYALK